MKKINEYFINFRNDLNKNINEDWNNLYFRPRINLNLRFHQEMITQKTFDLINQCNKLFLWACDWK